MNRWMDRGMAAAVDNIYPSKRAAAALQFKEKKRVAGEARRRGGESSTAVTAILRVGASKSACRRMLKASRAK